MPEENKPDNGKLESDQSKQEPAKELRLIITKNFETGHFGVQGPGNGQLYDKYICLGLLEDARDHIKVHNARMAQSQIIKPRSRIGDIFRKH